MRSLTAVLGGLGRALARPRLLAWIWLANLAIAMPGAVLVGDSIRRSVGASRVAGELTRGFDFGWYGEFRERAAGLDATFRPGLSGPGGAFSLLDGWLVGSLFELPPPVQAFGAVYALTWLFLVGGVLESLIRPPPSGGALESLTGGGARHFFRFLRLTLLTAPLYYGVYRLGRWLVSWVDGALREVTVERTALAAHLAAAAVVVILLAMVKMSADYAKIAIVSEGRRSALLALARAARFVLSHPLRTAGLVLWIAAASAAILAVWSFAAPGATQADPWALAGSILLAQAYLVARLVVRVGLLAGEASLFAETATDTLPRAR